MNARGLLYYGTEDGLYHGTLASVSELLITAGDGPLLLMAGLVAVAIVATRAFGVLRRPDTGFNYLGRVSVASGAAGEWEILPETAADAKAAAAAIVRAVADGELTPSEAAEQAMTTVLRIDIQVGNSHRAHAAS